ncbi:P-loop NTPase fold protein [Gimesia benthica]|nr:P-loop NTPase fold protein [Gimesia benthica]
MDGEPSTVCKTHLLNDLPSSIDAFASPDDVGPHRRVADAISNMIESSEMGGKAIGLEGGWGSGKSTVVQFITDRFKGNENYTVVLFDAWAHEGDPLRRTFLETVATSLTEYGWANKIIWKRKLEELANRRKTTTTKMIPKPTKLGKAMAISLLLVPIGTAFLAGGFRQGVSLGWLLSVNWFFFLGSLLSLSPFGVLFYRWLWLRYKVQTLTVFLVPIALAFIFEGLSKGVSLEWFLPPNWFFCIGILLLIASLWRFRYCYRNGNSSIRSHESESQDEEDDEFSNGAFLVQHTVNETKTETIETPDPTSLEFDEYFRDLMNESLSNDSRRLLLVLDNLDRVDAETALGIWGTLQTFLHDRNHDFEKWFKYLWVIVPYDPIRMRRLWNHPEEHELSNKIDSASLSTNSLESNGKSEVTRTTESFLDKSFQIRFHVAPPVLSDWKSFLFKLVERALPNHIEDQHIIYRVFDHCRARNGDPPTPRELKLYVNQIGAIHRQWQHEFPIGHVAYYVLSRKKEQALIDKMRRDVYPSDDDLRLLGDELKSSLAGLAFNVRAIKGLEILLAELITNALKDTTTKNLVDLEKRHGTGFWSVLEILASTKWYEEEPAGLATIALQLKSSGLLDNFAGPERAEIIKYLEFASKIMRRWSPITETEPDGICALLNLVDDELFSKKILPKVLNEFAKLEPQKDDRLDSKLIVDSLSKFLRTVELLNHNKIIPKKITLPFEGEEWVKVCPEIEKTNTLIPYRSRFKASGNFDSISNSLVSSISSGKFSDSHVIAFKITYQSAIFSSWQAIYTAIQQRLEADKNAPIDEVSNLLAGLLQMHTLNDEDALTILQAIFQSGHLYHHFHNAKNEDNESAQATIILCSQLVNPELPKSPSIGNSDSGFKMLMNVISSPVDSFISNYYEVSERFNLISELVGDYEFETEDKFHLLKLGMLKILAESDDSEIVFTSDFVMKNWKRLRSELNDESDNNRFRNILKILVSNEDFCELIINSGAGFDTKDVFLYLDIVIEASNEVPVFVNWCRQGLREMSEEAWKTDFRNEYACCSLVITLFERGVAPSLSNNFSDAIQDHVSLIINGDKLPPEWMQNKWTDILECLEETGTRKVLRDRIIRIAIQADGEICDEFFTMYGEEINDAEALASTDQVLSFLFTPIIKKKKKDKGLTWLEHFAAQNNDFLKKVSAEYEVQDFTNRLQDYVDESDESGVRDTITSIASYFGIERNPDLKNSDKSTEVEEENSSEE